MRLDLPTAAPLVDEDATNEFGTGLRARLELVRNRAPESASQPEPRASAERAGRHAREVSPELMLVSPEPEGPGGILAELLAQRAPEARREPLGALLAQAGLLDDAELEFGLAAARRSKKRLGQVLIEHGLVTPFDVVRLVAEQRGLPFVDIGALPVDPAAARLLPADRARLFRTLPIGFVRGLPVVALADPSNDEAIDGARSLLRAAEFVASPEESILAQLARLYVRPV